MFFELFLDDFLCKLTNAEYKAQLRFFLSQKVTFGQRGIWGPKPLVITTFVTPGVKIWTRGLSLSGLYAFNIYSHKTLEH